MKLKPRQILKARVQALKSSPPKSRDRLRDRVKVAAMLVVLSKRQRAA